MDAPKYIVTSLPGSSEGFLCVLGTDGTYEQFAQGDFQGLIHIARLLNEKTDALPVGPDDVVTEAVAPEDIQIGDHVLVEMIVTRLDPVGAEGHKHILAQPIRDNSWMLGNQYAWTWGWSQQSGKKIERIVNE